MNIPILYEDNHLLVVEKPVNIPVQEDQSGDQDLLNVLKANLKKRYQKKGNVYLGLVHRLDRPVGGVMVFAKTSKAASRLANDIRINNFQRTYVTVVHGIPNQATDKLIHYLVKDRRRNIVRTVNPRHKRGKKAILTYKVLHQDVQKQLSILSVQLHTGRSHQIRVQLSEVGHPIYGDQKYGRGVTKKGAQIALWAHTLQFPHTTKRELIKFHSNPPQYFPWTLWKE